MNSSSGDREDDDDDCYSVQLEGSDCSPRASKVCFFVCFKRNTASCYCRQSSDKDSPSKYPPDSSSHSRDVFAGDMERDRNERDDGIVEHARMQLQRGDERVGVPVSWQSSLDKFHFTDDSEPREVCSCWVGRGCLGRSRRRHFGVFHQLTEYAAKAIHIRDLLVLLDNQGNAVMNPSA